MRYLCKLLLSLALAGLSAEVACAQTNVTAASGSLKIAGTPISTGSIVFVPVDSSGNGIAVTYASGVTVPPYAQPKTGVPLGFTCSVSAGAISGSCPVPDTATSSPAGFAYNVTFVDLNSGKYGALNQVHGVTGATWALDHYQPSSVIPATGSYTVTYGSGAPVGTFGAGSFYFDISTASSPVMYASVNGAMQQVGGGSLVWGSFAGSGAPSPSLCGPTSYAKPYLDISVTPNVLYSCGSDGWVKRGSVSSSATISSANSSVQADSVVATTANGILHLGDSITVCYGTPVTYSPCGYAAMIDADYGLSGSAVSSVAVAGDNVQDESWHAFTSCNPGETGNPIITSMIGTNNASSPSGYLPVHMASHAWCGMSSTDKVLGNNPALAITGTYSTDTTWANANGITCTSGPCSITYSASIGTPNAFYVWSKQTASGGNYSVSVDGSPVSDVLTGLSSLSTTWTVAPAHQSASVSLARFYNSAWNTGAASTHSIVVTLQSGATFLGFGFPSTSRHRGLSGPRIIIGGVPPALNNLNAASIAIVNGYNLQTSQILVGDGINAPFVDVNAGLDKVRDFYGGIASGSITGSAFTVSSLQAGTTLSVGNTLFSQNGFAYFGVITGGSGSTFTVFPAASSPTGADNFAVGIQGAVGSIATPLHPNPIGHRHLAELFESVIGATVSPSSSNATLVGPLNVTTPAAITSETQFNQLTPHNYTDSLIGGTQQCSGTTCGTKMFNAAPVAAGLTAYGIPSGYGFGSYAAQGKPLCFGQQTGSAGVEADFIWPACLYYNSATSQYVFAAPQFATSGGYTQTGASPNTFSGATAIASLAVGGGASIANSSNVPQTSATASTGTCTANGYITVTVNGVSIKLATCQ